MKNITIAALIINLSLVTGCFALTDAPSSVTVKKSFEGVNGAAFPVYKDHPDASGAVGPNHVVDFVGSGFVVHDKTTGAVLQSLTAAKFWINAGMKPGRIDDPTMAYDPFTKRWYAACNCP